MSTIVETLRAGASMDNFEKVGNELFDERSWEKKE
jgi:hypothetical protein